MRKLMHTTLTLMLSLAAVSQSSAQIQTPRPSPLATLKQKVALTDVEVTYSRPGVKGRTIYGDLVAYNEVWRTGANAVTTVTFSDEVFVNGKPLGAGKYALLSIPGEKEWTVIFSKDAEIGGVSEYKQETDAARISVKPRMLRDAVETFTIDFTDFKDEGATMSMTWQNTAIDVQVTMDIDSKIEASIKTTLFGGATEPKAGDYHNAAVYYMGKGKELDKALEWMNKSVEMSPNAFWYVHRQAELLGKMGRKEEAIKTAERSMQMAKANKDGDFGYVKRNEDLIGTLRSN
jgi:hypothetical protein